MIINRILKPLVKAHQIDYFTHCVYNNSNCSLISSDPKAAMLFINDKKSIMPIEISNKLSELLSWEEYCSPEYLDYITQRYEGRRNGVTIVLRHSHSQAEHITLHSCNNEINLQDYLNSNKDISSNIIRHIRNSVFMSKQKPNAIQFDKKHKIQITKDSLSMNEKHVPQFKKFYIVGKKGETHLTKQELECIKHLVQLKTTTTLATDMNLHKKTIESHIASARKKLGVKNRNELYEIACKNFIHLPPYAKH